VKVWWLSAKVPCINYVYTNDFLKQPVCTVEVTLRSGEKRGERGRRLPVCSPAMLRQVLEQQSSRLLPWLLGETKAGRTLAWSERLPAREPGGFSQGTCRYGEEGHTLRCRRAPTAKATGNPVPSALLLSSGPPPPS